MGVIGIRETVRRIRADARSYADFTRRNPQWGAISRPFMAPGFWAVFLYRWSRFFYFNHLKFLSRILHFTNIALTRAEISPQSDLGEGAVVLHSGGLIVSTANIGRFSVFAGRNGLGGGGKQRDIGAGPGQPMVGDHFFMSPGSFVLGACRIGQNVTAGPLHFIHKDIKDGHITEADPDSRHRGS